MKIIGPITYSDLNLIKEIRNAFAHCRLVFGFQTPEVAAVCKELQIPNLKDSMNSSPFMTTARASIADPPLARAQFVSACHNVSYRMLVKRFGFREGDTVFTNDEPLP